MNDFSRELDSDLHSVTWIYMCNFTGYIGVQANHLFTQVSTLNGSTKKSRRGHKPQTPKQPGTENSHRWTKSVSFMREHTAAVPSQQHSGLDQSPAEAWVPSEPD